MAGAEPVRVRVTALVTVMTDASLYDGITISKSERNQVRRNKAKEGIYLALNGSSSISNIEITKCRLVQEGIEDDE